MYHKSNKPDFSFWNKNALSYGEEMKDDLQEIMYQGIMRYDALRKQRKQEKRKVQHQQRQQQQVLNTIQKANGVPKLGGHYGNCFNFS